MRNFLTSIIKNKKIIIFIAFAIGIMGIFSYNVMPKKQSPKINLATAMITTIYPGSTADDIEKLITSKIESKLSDMDEKEEIISYSRDSNILYN